MDKAALLRHLEEARREADRGDGLIEAQRGIVASLKAAGGDARAAENALDAMEQTQNLRLAEIDRLLDALDEKTH